MKTHLTGFQVKLTACGAVGWNITTERWHRVTCQRCTKTHNYKTAQMRHEEKTT